jgi:nucleotide-binding universal stress UspA family protein
MIRIEKILCPVDFFPASLRAFDYALGMAANYGAGIHILHVVAPIIPSAYNGPLSLGTLTAEVIAQSEASLEGLKKKGLDAGITVDAQVVEGDIDAQIIHTVRSARADLVIMGTHGRRGFQRWLMGSVTERMMRTCPVPLLLTESAPKKRAGAPRLRHLLLTTDFSRGTDNAVRYAFSIANRNQARVTFLHVVDDLSAPLGGKRTQQLLLDIRQRLEDLVPSDPELQCEVVARVETGEPHATIVKIMEKEKVGLVVMNIHGKNLLDRASIGSTAERVVRFAGDKCPVLLIPPVRARRGIQRRGDSVKRPSARPRRGS